MKKYYILPIILFIFLTSTASYSAWDKQCLDDCFSTHHDCGYCNYQCEVSNQRPNNDEDTNDNTCPAELRGYNSN